MTPPLLGEGHGGRKPRRESRALLNSVLSRKPRNANLADSVIPSVRPPPTAAPVNFAARNDPFSHIQILPKPPVEESPEQRMQRTNPFVFKKTSFSEEAEANLSSHSNPYDGQDNLANASGGASFAQKARAAELNAARARRAAQMQSIDDEIPDLSGPVSLGTYKFTRRDRSKKYETHKLSELQENQEKEGENKVTEPALTSSANPPSNPPLPTTLSSSQLIKHRTHQVEVEVNDKILKGLDSPSPDKRGFHEPGPPHQDKLHPSDHDAAIISSPSRSIYTDRQSSQAAGQAKSSLPPAQDHRSSQDSNASVNPDTSSSQTFGQADPSVSPADHFLNQHFGATINPNIHSSRLASGQTDISFPLQDHSSDQTFNAPINTDGRSPKASRRRHPLFQPPHRKLDTSELYRQLAKSLNAFIKTDRRSSKASGQAQISISSQSLERHTSESYHESENKFSDLLATHRQSSQASGQVHHPASPKDNSSLHSLPLSDTLRTASFNFETNQWDPDLPDVDMSTQTPTNKSTRGGHAGQQSSRNPSSRMSHPSQQVRNPYAIVTTTKSGRPYTNPYMPIDPPPSTARQVLRGSPTGHNSLNTQYDDPETVECQRKLRYVDQEEARYRALEQELEREEKSMDDPFQDQPTHIQHYGHNQPSNYADHASQQAAYGQPPDYGHQPTFSTYASGPSASSYLSNAPQATHAPSTGMSPYRSSRAAYDQQPAFDNRGQNPGAIPYETRLAYEQQFAMNPRASVRLPAVRGTIDQQKVFPHEPKFESLSLGDSAGKNAQEQRQHQTQGGVQPASGRASRAVPIRDPAAYTGSGLTTGRNQEALRQNLDTVVASSQGPTGSARTVMNDPHRDRQPSGGRPSSTVTDTTVTGSTLRAQAPSYESVITQHPAPTNAEWMNPRPGTSTIRRQGMSAPGASETLPPQSYTGNTLPNPERTTANTEVMNLHQSYQAPEILPNFDLEAVAYTRNAGLPAVAIGAGNAFMKEISRNAPPPKRNFKQRTEDSNERLEDAAAWFRADPRDLSYAAAILPYETMNRMNPEQFPLDGAAPRSVSALADDSQDDDPSDQTRQATTPRPIGHGRPAGFTTPPSNHGGKRATIQAPISTLADVTSIHDKEGMARSGRKFLDDEAKGLAAMFGGVYSNLMAAKNGPYDYMNHYAPPPAYAIDHNPMNNHTFFDPEWFATAPPARVGRDPRREQGEYEDPTQGSAGRRGDHVRGEVTRRGSGGHGGSGGRAWGKN